MSLGSDELTADAARDTLGALLKYQEDLHRVNTDFLLDRLTRQAHVQAADS